MTPTPSSSPAMRERTHPAETWRPGRSFANTDSRAVKLAEILHGARQPQLTILFGSRARGDYAEGRSDIDILLLESHPPDDGVAECAAMAFRRAKAELYRGQRIDFDQVVSTPEEFRKRCSGVNSVEGHALKDGYILGEGVKYYAALARRMETRHQTRWANERLEFLKYSKNAEDWQGIWAYSAVAHALQAAINAAGEWCPEIHDVEMLLELANQADPEGHYATILDPEIYTQYGDNRRGIPPHTPFTSRPEHRECAIQDVQAALARAEDLKASWPQPESTSSTTSRGPQQTDRQACAP